MRAASRPTGPFRRSASPHSGENQRRRSDPFGPGRPVHQHGLGRVPSGTSSVTLHEPAPRSCGVYSMRCTSGALDLPQDGQPARCSAPARQLGMDSAVLSFGGELKSDARLSPGSYSCRATLRPHPCFAVFSLCAEPGQVLPSAKRRRPLPRRGCVAPHGVRAASNLAARHRNEYLFGAARVSLSVQRPGRRTRDGCARRARSRPSGPPPFPS